MQPWLIWLDRRGLGVGCQLRRSALCFCLFDQLALQLDELAESLSILLCLLSQMNELRLNLFEHGGYHVVSIVKTKCSSADSKQGTCKCIKQQLYFTHSSISFAAQLVISNCQLPSNDPTIDQYLAEFVWIFSFSCDVFTAACKWMKRSRSALSSKLNSSTNCFSLWWICKKQMIHFNIPP